MDRLTATETSMLERQSRSLVAHAMHRLLHKLKAYVEVRPFEEGDKLAEHDVVWVSWPDNGPEKTIGDAMVMTPALWVQALPPEVCLVSRKSLEGIMSLNLHLNPEDMIEYLRAEGANIVMSRAAQKLHELEDAERR